MRSLEVEISAKVISFSVENRRADALDRGLIISRLPGWTGPLIDLDECHLKGTHNAENIMAALCVGHVLAALEEMVAAVKEYRSGPHRFETVGEINGVTFINDSKAMNVEATRRALLSLGGKWSEANVWLIAGGQEKGLAYHDLDRWPSESNMHSLSEKLKKNCKRPGDCLLLAPQCKRC